MRTKYLVAIEIVFKKGQTQGETLNIENITMKN